MADRSWWRLQALILTSLLLLLLTIATPAWLRLDGMPPSWPVLWLLPWAVVEGPIAGALAAVLVGLGFDSFYGQGISSIPVLVLLALWWGQFRDARRPLERSTTLGLQALLGSFLLSASFALQLHWRGGSVALAWQVSLAQALLTALLAPVVCSVQVLLWRRLTPDDGR